MIVRDKAIVLDRDSINDCVKQFDLDAERLAKLRDDYVGLSSITKRVQFVGKEDVYNMEVKEHHNFAVNDGLIVHNCVDALRYAMESESTARYAGTLNLKGL